MAIFFAWGSYQFKLSFLKYCCIGKVGYNNNIIINIMNPQKNHTIWGGGGGGVEVRVISILIKIRRCSSSF